ncbi:tyrosyl-DNA phosphodiesterase-domain-containing protein [Aspergillus keveii]|uniref:Tyrosyl-DNA phosphodiesterase-domain-containing protein n=1 Tax=Aspergillus keveii TaxID=714993 RepID=A0ABR4FQG4_9EURO
MDSEDEALRAAIAASLEDVQAPAQTQANNNVKSVVDLTGDSDDDDVMPTFPISKSVIGSETSRDVSVLDDAEDEDEDLERAIALSLQAAGGQDNPRVEAITVPPVKEQTQAKDEVLPENSAQLFLSLDRKKMEAERLARLAKRKAEDGPGPDQRNVKQPRIEAPVQHTQASGPSSAPSIQFPDGTVKKTFAFGYRRTHEDIKIEEVLQKSNLELAVLSSFMWDMEWLFSKVDLRNTRFIMVMQAKDDVTKRQYESETASMKNLRLCFPPMDGQVNCMHSKLMLLFHPGYLRIAVPTANLVPFDWGETGGIMENSVFLIDLPKRDPTVPTTDSKTNFYTDLVYFLKASTLHDNIIAKLKDFDFSKTAQFAFVHTMHVSLPTIADQSLTLYASGGSHLGSSWKQTGYCGLGRSLEALGLKTNTSISLDYVTSSLGSIVSDFMKCIYLAAQGDSGLTELTLRTSKSLPAKDPTDPRRLITATTADEWKDRMRIYFPSQETVLRSKGGPNSAGTICFQSKWFESGKFPVQALRDCRSVRDGMVMHNKIAYVQPDKPILLSETTECPGWAYVGSANLSESAWGRLVQDRSTKQPKLNCRNWECGVIVPVIKQKPTTTNAERITNNSEVGFSSKHGKGSKVEENTRLLDIFAGTVPVPMRVPGPRFDGSRKPWYFMEMD